MTWQERGEILTTIDSLASKLCDAVDAGNVVAKSLVTIWLELIEAKANSQNGAATSAPDDRLMTADEVAEYLRVKKQTIYVWVSDKSIPHEKPNGEIRFRRSALDAWMTPNNDNIEKAREKARACGKVKPLFPAAKQIRSNNDGRL